MKYFAIVLLLIAVGMLAFDDQQQRSKMNEIQKALTDAQDATNQATTNANKLTNQVDLMKQQVKTLQAQKDALDKRIAAATPTPAPAPVATPPPIAAATVPPGPPLETGFTPTKLVEDYSNALAIIEGRNAVGSGFVCNVGGKNYVFTNAHVLCDNPAFKVTSIKGTVYNVGASAVAVGRDMVKLEVTGADKAFDAADNVNAIAKIGDAVTVLGNSEGAGVVKPVEGKIVGIGPDLVEVDAQFVKGNSGSPIIHEATGKVIGIATYLIEHKVDQAQGGGVQTEVRRFGYRIDGVKQWQAINWQTFYAQSAQLTAMETLSDDFIKMFGDTNNNLNFDPTSYSSPALQRSIRSFLQSIREGGSNMSVADKKSLVQGFIADLRSVSHADVVLFNKTTAYDYFLREVEDQSRFRDEIYEGLTKALQSVQ